MPRPKKCRRICALPRCSSFGPLEGAADGRVEMAVEEYEAIRLIDLLGCTQEECAAQMGVARSTVQQVYDTARAGWLRPWWRGGACTSPAETMCSAPGERSVPAGTAPAGLRYGTLWLRRVPAVQGKLGGYENENRGYL